MWIVYVPDPNTFESVREVLVVHQMQPFASDVARQTLYPMAPYLPAAVIAELQSLGCQVHEVK